MIFDACREDWEADLDQRVAEVSGDQVRAVLDELVTPGIDPVTLPAPESIPLLIAALTGIGVGICGIAAVLFGVG